MIRIDTTDWSHVVTCTECPSWRELCYTRTAAWTVAAGHLSRTHGDVHAATKARAAAATAQKRRRSTDSDPRGNPSDTQDGGTTARTVGEHDRADGHPGVPLV